MPNVFGKKSRKQMPKWSRHISIVCGTKFRKVQRELLYLYFPVGKKFSHRTQNDQTSDKGGKPLTIYVQIWRKLVKAPSDIGFRLFEF